MTTVPKTKVRPILAMPKALGLVRGLRGSRFELLQTDVPDSRLQVMAGLYAARADQDREKLERLALFAQSAQCRWKVLLEYFGDADGFDRCGR